MKRNNLLKCALFFIAFYLLTGLVITDSASSYDFADWGSGVVGYEIALLDAEEEEKPVVLYFHTKTGKWSKKMTNTYIAHYEIEEFLTEIPKAHIEPYEGTLEEAIANKYGVKEYPTLLILIPAINGKPDRLHPFSKDQNMTIEEFLKALKQKITHQYNQRGYESFKKKQYEEALKYLQMSLDIDPENAYTYYAMGMVYQSTAAIKDDLKIIKTAEENYIKALKYDPNHKESRVELEKLRKYSEKMGLKK
ncbi:MAG: tetratricopeptide repeat protein [Desulfobacteraceae bacterium]|nr:tetratricopeptide repeat protein [Desulfobacteraceae bacterium]